jgi:hypothetical protein
MVAYHSKRWRIAKLALLADEDREGVGDEKGEVA